MKKTDLDFYDGEIFVARLTMKQEQLDEYLRPSNQNNPNGLFYSLDHLIEYFEIRPHSYRTSLFK